MFCTGCGAQLPDNSMSCPYCGLGVLGEAQSHNDSNMNNNPNMCSAPNMGNNPDMDNNPKMGNNANMANNPHIGANPNMSGNANMGGSPNVGDMNGNVRNFCMSCGFENDSDSRFCVVCGKPLAESQTRANADPRSGADLRYNTNPNYNTNPSVNYDSNNGQQSWDTWNRDAAANQQKKNYRKIGIIGAGVIVAAALILVFGVFGVFSKRSYEDTIEQVMNAAMYGDISGLYELIHPDIFTNQINEMLEEYDAEMEYEIRYTEELTGSSLADIQDTYDDYGLDVDEAMVVAVKMTLYSERYDIEEEEYFDIYLIKIDGDWYLDTENTIDLFGSGFSFSLF